ncbi:alpha-2Db adrenergic receptor-like isoform X1 [Littorina saxatilis]|uniref:G-protein coupled receptors family 1 profile domain-containing protein n=1 Tax=Littorina saxatilis TaxID=31220 RepID=A0AAN9C328_9CAEN
MATKAVFTTPATTASAIITNATQAFASNTTDLWKHPTINRADSFWGTVYTTVEVVSSVLSVFILGLNLLVLVVILSSSPLRSRPRNQLLLSLVAVFLMLGVFDTAFSADYASKRQWSHGCYFHVVRSLLVRYVQYFVSIWGVVVLILHYLLRLLRYEGPQWLMRLPAWVLRAVTPLFVASPWITAVVVMVPLVFGGLHKHAYLIWTDSRCPLILERWATVLDNMLSFFLPALVIVALTIAIMVLHRRQSKSGGVQRGGGGEMGAELVEGGEDDVEAPLVFELTGVMILCFHAPEHIFYASRLPFTLSWRTAVSLSVTMELFSELLPIVLAALWLWLFQDLKERLVELVAKLPCCLALCPFRSPPKSSGETTVPHVAFRDLHDE